jgi:membrane protease YdiL (CAAX protease family)
MLDDQQSADRPLLADGPLLDVPSPARHETVPLAARLGAVVEILLCSDIPTQLFLMYVLGAAGMRSMDEAGRLSIAYVATLSLVDAVLLGGLVWLLLRVHGEQPREVFLDRRPVGREAALGLVMTPAVFMFALLLLGFVLRFAPWLHNVPENPLADLIRRPQDAVLFGAVSVVAGGMREEVQRAFVLRRFEQYLGGGPLGLVIFSMAFGAGHLIQGWDVAIITASLGALWGIVYLRRRSIVAPVVSHSLFNVGQIVQHTVIG